MILGSNEQDQKVEKKPIMPKCHFYQNIISLATENKKNHSMRFKRQPCEFMMNDGMRL